MKRPRFIYRGEPEERQRHLMCIAYDERGRLCHKPASVLDPQRGGFICDHHAAQLVAKLRKEAGERQAA